MPQPKTRRVQLILWILFLVVGSDQLSKAWARSALGFQNFSFLGDTLRLGIAENPGAFLSLGAGLQSESRFYIFTVSIAIFLAITLWVLFKKSHLAKWPTIAYTLVVAGGVGNLIDRAAKGTVTDFMNVGIGWLRTGVFNIADMAIMAAIGVLIASSFGPEQTKAKRLQKS
jgi:signal peptidase II